MREEEISELLASEAERMERSKDRRRHVRSSTIPQDPSQVYSMRIPVSRLEQLRRIAGTKGERRTALLRRWALERLSEEMSKASNVSADSPAIFASPNQYSVVSVEASRSEFVTIIRRTSARTMER